MKILVTGCAGFIGMQTCLSLVARGDEVIGIDNLNDYYETQLKNDRLAYLEQFDNFSFKKMDITDAKELKYLFKNNDICSVIHLAAQAGVRYSISNPLSYVQSNLVGFLNILETCRYNKVQHLVFASSSSVYGANTSLPYSVKHNVDHPVSFYAATKKSGELMAHSYSCLYNIPITCLRFFTVYGPWGRPDMSPFIFTKAILERTPINLFNYGKMKRDFTFIDDVAKGILMVLDSPAKINKLFDCAVPDPSTSFAPYCIYNMGNHQPVDLLEFIKIIEEELNIKAIINFKPMQSGDVVNTYAENNDYYDKFGIKPNTSLKLGMKEFIIWYINYYKIKN
jgi:UDP-glucuronate 4-epimerase